MEGSARTSTQVVSENESGEIQNGDRAVEGTNSVSTASNEDAINTEVTEPLCAVVVHEEKSTDVPPSHTRRRKRKEMKDGDESEDLKKDDLDFQHEPHKRNTVAKLENEEPCESELARSSIIPATYSDDDPTDLAHIPFDPHDVTHPQSSQQPNPPPRTKRNPGGYENAAFTNDESDTNDRTTSPCETKPKPDATENTHLTKGDNVKKERVRLRKELGLVNCVGLIMGNIIGSGIFVSPRAVLQYTGSVGMSLAVWVASGLVAMVGAICFAEMGTMIPQSGGNYTYLHEAFGPLPAFLYLWMVVAIGIPSGRAVGALTFSHYILQPFFPVGQEPPASALRLLAVLIILLLTFISSKKVKWATTVQEILALTKVFALIVIIIVGFHHLTTGHTQHFEDPMAGTNWDPSLIATAFYHTLWAYDGWDTLNIIMEELKEPNRDVPRAITISMGSIIVIYVLTNAAYFAVIPKDDMLSSVAVAVTFGQLALGTMAWTVPIFVACSTGGGLNGNIFATSRMIHVSSRRGHLPKVLSYIHIKNHTPITSLIFTAAISMVMFTTSDVRVLINYTGFAGNLVGLLVLASFFYFRIKKPDLHRPIKVWIGFPILFTIVSVFLTVFPAIRQPTEMLAALLVIATGLPIYYFAIYRQDKPKPIIRAMDKVTQLAQILFLAAPEELEEEMTHQ